MISAQIAEAGGQRLRPQSRQSALRLSTCRHSTETWLRAMLWFAALALFCVGSVAQAAVPNRTLSMVVLPASAGPAALPTVDRVALHARDRLGINPQKLHRLDHRPTRTEFIALFRTGAPFQYISQGDLLVVYLADVEDNAQGLVLADGVLPWTELTNISQWLRDGPGQGQGFFNGTVLVVLDRRGAGKLRPKLPQDTAWLDLSAPRAPAVDPTLPAPEVRDPLVIAGRGALAEAAPDVTGLATPGAVAWVGALERLLADPSQPGDVLTLRALAAAARDGTGVSPTLLTDAAWESGRFRLLIQSLRVVLHPRLLANLETVAVLDTLKAQLEAAVPPALKGQIKIERTDEADPSADVACAALANRTTAHLECVEGSAPVFADQLDVTNPEEALAPVVRQILRDYKALAATDWSARRRDLKPLDVVLLLDTSLSMAYHDPTRDTDDTLPPGPSKREIFLVRLAATLAAHAESTGRPARLTTLLFGDTVTPLVLPGGESLTLTRRLDAGQLAAIGAAFRAGARPMPYTGIRDALTRAALVLAAGDPGAARHVVLLTDGRESVVTAEPERAVREAAAAVHALGATLHTVGLTEGVRLEGYLARIRQGGEVLRRYVDLLDMTYAPVECRRHSGWSESIAQRCGAFYARAIQAAGAYDPFVLDRIRRAQRPGVPTGVFLQPDSSAAFQAELQTLLSTLTGGGVYLTASAEREGGAGGSGEAGSAPSADGRTHDTWRFDLDLPGSARVVLYNRTGLADLTWKFLHDGQPMGTAEGVRVVQESEAVTVVTLPAPARGVWIIEREGARP